MTYVKAAIGTTLLLICLLVGYMFIAFDSQYELDVAYNSFLKGHYQEAFNELARLEEGLPEDQRQLYQSYALRGLRRWDEAAALLEQSIFQAQQRRQHELVLEGFLNQSLNAYLRRDVEQLRIVLSHTEQLSSSQPWITFFQAIERYLSEDYSQALELWSLPYNRLPLSGWMKKAFDDTFTRLWMLLRLTRCQIEEGKYLLARQTLEEEVDSVTEGELHEVYFLLGLSYAKEAQDKPMTAAAPYFKLATSYFNRVPMQSERYIAERRRLLGTIAQTAHRLIEKRAFSDLPFYGSVLQSWEASDELAEIAEDLIAILDAEIRNQDWQQVTRLTNILNRLVLDEEERAKLQKRFYSLAEAALDEGNTDLVKEYWPAAYIFSNSSSELATRFTKHLTKRIHSLLPADDQDLKLITPYLRLWLEAEKNRDARVTFAQELIGSSERLWKQEGGEAKASALMQLSLTLPFATEREDVRQELEKAMVRVYNETTKRDDIDKLPLVFAAIERMDLGTIDLKQTSETKKHLASAQELLAKGDYDEALRRSLWVLQLEPDNQLASEVAGKVFYRLAKYTQALEHLKEVKEPDLGVLEALAISQILSGQDADGQQLLAELTARHTLTDESYLRLGLGLLVLDQVDEGKEWLEKITHHSPESSIALAYTSYLLGDHNEVPAKLGHISPPHLALDAVQGLVIRSDIAKQELSRAEKSLIKLLNEPRQPSTQGMTPPFQVFEEKKLSLFGRYFIAGLFFRENKKKNEVAIKYFDLIKKPTPEMQVVRGATRLDLGDYDNAIEDLLASATQDKDRKAQQEAMPLLAQAYTGKREAVRALSWYQRFFEQEKTDLRFRGSYAKVLSQLRRYDLALEEYRLLGAADQLKPEDTVGLVNALIHTNRFEEAVEEGSAFLALERPLPLTTRLELARLMVIANSQELTWPLLKSLPPVENFSQDESIAIIHFLMEIGSYGQALSVANSREEDLSKTIEGLLIQAELQQKLSHYTDAFAFIQKAKALNPTAPAVNEVLTEYARDIKILETLANEAERAVDKDPDNLAPKIAYGQRMAALGSWARASEDDGQNRYLSDIQKALFHLEKLLEKQPDLPIVHDLQGQLYTLLNKPEEALKAYRKAIALDPSYSEAFDHLAYLYRRLGDNRSAIRALYQAAKFDPSDAEAWQKLAELYYASGNLYEASNYYQNAIKFRPSNLRNYIALGHVFLELRNPEDAKMILEHATELSPNHLGVMKALFECLHDPLLHVATNDRNTLIAQRQELYNKIHKIDPKAAKETLENINNNRPHWDFDFPPIDASEIWPEQPSSEGL